MEAVDELAEMKDGFRKEERTACLRSANHRIGGIVNLGITGIHGVSE
jgi:hypothetical protein